MALWEDRVVAQHPDLSAKLIEAHGHAVEDCQRFSRHRRIHDQADPREQLVHARLVPAAQETWPSWRIVLEAECDPSWTAAARVREEVQAPGRPAHGDDEGECRQRCDDGNAERDEQLHIEAQSTDPHALHWVDGKKLEIESVELCHEPDENLWPLDAREATDSTETLCIAKADFGQARADGKEVRCTPPHTCR